MRRGTALKTVGDAVVQEMSGSSPFIADVKLSRDARVGLGCSFCKS